MTVRDFVKDLRAAGADVACVRGAGQTYGTPTRDRQVPPIPGVPRNQPPMTVPTAPT